MSVTKNVDDVLEFDGSIAFPPRTNTAGSALTIAEDDGSILFSSNNTGAIVISGTDMADGQICTLCMETFDTDDYTMVVSSGTLTFNATDELAVVWNDGAAIRVLSLNGATIV